MAAAPAPRASRMRRTGRVAAGLLAALLVCMALAAVVVAQLLPWAERNPARVEAWLSARADMPVHFDALQTEWSRRGPLLRVTGLRIGDPATALPLGTAEIQIAQYSGLLPGRSLTELRLHGLDLTLRRDDDGSWGLLGLPGQERAGGDPLAALERLGELQVVAARLTVDAPSLSLHHTLPRIDLRMQVDRNRARIAARAWITGDGQPVDAHLQLRRASGDGRGYVAMPCDALQVWSPLLAASGLSVTGGRGQVRNWVDIRARRVAAVTTDLALENLVLQRADATADGGDAPQVRFDLVEARARWVHEDAGWRLDLPRLRVDQQGRAQVLDGLAVGGGERMAMKAGRIEVAPLLALAALADGVPPSMRDWLQAAAPHAVLADIELAALRDGPLRIAARVESLGFDPVDDRPGLDGIAGTLTGDAQGLVFQLDPAARPVFDWPVGFGVPHPLRLDGTLAGWRDDDGWHFGTAALRVEGDGYAAHARGSLWFQGDGTRPVMDLAARVDTARIPVAKKFWVRHEMPQAAMDWLDMALVAGEVRDGRGIVSGDLDDWPFSADDGHDTRGVFVAEGRLVDATVRFQPDWPALEGLDGPVRFVNDGFTLDDAKGRLMDVAIDGIHAGMRHYAHSPVDVRAHAAGDAAAMRALLRQSPFQASHGDTLDNLQAAGPATSDLVLSVPQHAPLRVDGRVQLAGVSLADPRFDLALSDVRGETRFDAHGFSGDALAVVRDGQPGRLALRAGTGHVRDARQAFEGELAIPLAAADLLARTPDLAWLQPLVGGRSPWTVEVTVPEAPSPGSGEALLRMRSDLVGTALHLPAPLDKPAPATLPTTIEAPLPFGTGDVEVGFGNVLALRAGTRDAQSGVRVALGTARVAEAPPASGLAIAGRTPVVDLQAWLGLVRGGDGDDAVGLNSVDLVADDLRLFGGGFGQTRIVGARRGDVTELGFDGAAIAGTVRIPEVDGAPVDARLQRLYWQASPASGSDTGPDDAAAPAAPADAVVDADDAPDPAALPPIHVVVDDLRVGTLASGTASLRTRRVPGGLEVEQLHLRAPGQRIDVTGHWTGQGGAARTQLRADVDSDDFGVLLSSLGFAGSIAGGHGRAGFDATWPGPPTAFDVARLQGGLHLDVSDGQLVEVEPGAGRVLGLLSVAELPRRLMLDFRDFFSKGLGFNRLIGDVRFDAARARTDNVVIAAPAADIRIHGTSDLRARTHDQRVEVLPRTGNLLPAVGALTAGPVGAAVGAVANAVLRRPLGEIGAKTYHVSGPWQAPEIEVVDRRDSASAPPVPDDGARQPPSVD
ncbi:TIGR02099 family protein [Luteimonas sp. BDR2-5]|uniref:YhdP family protein n=1 Tax=Proluteimonas luteida TaxID=2878685 RepID=UPI001E55844F|nr:YhdP family protein [Luteimonas sp. BDR2-5]MCD9028099.1 TIGR02099 family protein [Luteimonas sp. BDR2-5]